MLAFVQTIFAVKEFHFHLVWISVKLFFVFTELLAWKLVGPADDWYNIGIVANFSDQFEVRLFHLVTKSEQVQNTVNSIIV